MSAVHDHLLMGIASVRATHLNEAMVELFQGAGPGSSTVVL